MYTTLYENAGLTKFNYEKAIEWFETHQGQWSEALYNFGSKQYYGGAPYSKWISSGLGDKKNQRRFWLYYGFRYRASKYHAGSSINRITWRQFGTGSDLQMKTYSEMYVSLGFGAYDYKTTKRYRCLDLENGVTVKNEFTTNVNDVVMYLFNGDMITDIGNLYEFGNIGSLDLTAAKRLRWLRVGNKDRKSNTHYVNTKLTALALTTCDALEYLDLTGCEGFGTGTGQNGIYTLDLSSQKLLQEFYCSGATMSGITFPETSSLTKVHIGDNLSRLRLVNLPSLSEFTMDGGSKLQSVIMRNCGDISKTSSYDILVSILSSENSVLNEIEVDGIDWQNASAEVIEMLCDRKAKLKGKINIEGNNQMTFELKRKLALEYGNIDDPNNNLHITYVVRSIENVSMPAKVYYSEVGKYQLAYSLNSPYANNYVREEWSMPSSLYATIDTATGLLDVTRIGKEIEGDGPNVDVTVTLYLMDGSTISATSNINFWYRDAKLGDIVYHDGTYSAAEDYEDQKAAGKTAIGVCFYIDKNDKTRRLMVSKSYIASAAFGPSSASIAGITLADNPSISVYDVEGLINATPTTSLDGLRSSSTSDGWANLDGNSNQAGQIGWKVLTKNELGYKIGDSLPWGKYNQLHILALRNEVLNDSNFNLPIPEPLGELSESSVLTSYMSEAVSLLGTGYDALYYPAASRCYAYVPSIKEGTLDKFKAHNWWMPSYGELMRIAYYYRQYKTASTNTEDNPLNIFRGAINVGVFSGFGSGVAYGASAETTSASTNIYRVIVNNSSGNWGGAGGTTKNTATRILAICEF